MSFQFLLSYRILSSQAPRFRITQKCTGSRVQEPKAPGATYGFCVFEHSLPPPAPPTPRPTQDEPRLASPFLQQGGSWPGLGKAFGKATGRVLRQGVCQGPGGYVPRVPCSGSVRVLCSNTPDGRCTAVARWLPPALHPPPALHVSTSARPLPEFLLPTRGPAHHISRFVNLL